MHVRIETEDPAVRAVIGSNCFLEVPGDGWEDGLGPVHDRMEAWCGFLVAVARSPGGGPFHVISQSHLPTFDAGSEPSPFNAFTKLGPEVIHSVAFSRIGFYAFQSDDGTRLLFRLDAKPRTLR
jgi:hypothetical protein